MYSNVKGKLVESKVITIAPKGLMDYIVNKFDSGLVISETQVRELRVKLFEMEEEIIDGRTIDDEDILTFAKIIEIRLWQECNVLTDIVRAIFYIGDGSSHNKMMVLEQIRLALDITWIQILKDRAKKKRRGNSYANNIQR